MKHPVIHIDIRLICTTLMTVLYWAVSFGGNSERYGTQRLAMLSEVTGLDSLVDTLPDSCYRGMLKWRDLPVSVRIEGGEVTHLGINLFSPEERENLMNSPVCDFLERYLLEHYAIGDKTVSGLDRKKTERVEINRGKLEDLHRLENDTAATYSISLEDGRKYTFSLLRNDREILNLSFPASHRLMGGYAFDEDAGQLQRKIERTDSTLRPLKPMVQESLIPCDSIQGDYFIEKGSFSVLPIVNNDRYYLKNDSTMEILNNPIYPVESLANLLVSGEVENQYTAKVRMLRYQAKSMSF